MNRKFLLFIVILLGITGFVSAQIPSLNDALASIGNTVRGRIPNGATIAIISFESPSDQLSDYVLRRMTANLTNASNGQYSVVDRQSIDAIRSEMNYQLSGEVDDNSAMAIGKQLGAQFIVVGSCDDAYTNYYFQFRLIEIQSARLLVSPDSDVAKDQQMLGLLGGSAPAPAQAVAPPPSQLPKSSTGYPNGLNYSGGMKFVYGFLLNQLFGLGSFIMGDVTGGIIIGALEAAGFVLLILGPSETAIGYSTYEYDYTTMYIGLGVYIGGVIFGWFRPWSYDKSLAKANGTYYAQSKNPMDHLGIDLVADKQNTRALRLTYSLSF
jgi:TolB-like protein